jgi:hypothetical protein
MEDRDEKGRFTKGHGSITSKEQAKEMGAKGGSITKQNRVEKWIKAVEGPGAHPITKDEAASIDRYLLCQTNNELQKIAERKDVPIIIQARAKQLVDSKNAFDATEKLLDRAFGKPKQQEEHIIEGTVDTAAVISYPDFIKSIGIDTTVTDEELYEP